MSFFKRKMSASKRMINSIHGVHQAFYLKHYHDNGIIRQKTRIGFCLTSKNYPKSKALRKLEKLTLSGMLSQSQVNTEENIRNHFSGLNSKPASTTNTQIESS